MPLHLPHILNEVIQNGIQNFMVLSQHLITQVTASRPSHPNN